MPEVGEVALGKAIGKSSEWGRSHMFQWMVCPVCGRARWVFVETLKRPTYTGLCTNCIRQDNELHQRIVRRKGENHPSWKGGRILHKSGYIQIKNRVHPGGGSKGYVMEHRLVIEKHLGRYLTSDEIIHHLNGRKTDNRLENLAIVSRHSHDKLTIRKAQQKRIRELEAQLAQQRLALVE